MERGIAELLTRPVGRQYAPADRRAVASGGVAEAAEAGKSIQNQEWTEGCLTKPDGKAAVSNAGLALGQMGPRAEPKKTLALEYLNVCPRSQTNYPMQDKVERVANQNGNSG